MANNFKLDYTGNQINELLQKTDEIDLSTYATKSYVDQEVGNIDIPEIIIDDTLSTVSENPVQNKLITNELFTINKYNSPNLEAVYGAQTWSMVDPDANTNYRLTDIVYGNNMYVVIGYSGFIATSDTGAVWTVQNSGVTDNLTSIVFGQDKFIISGNGYMLHSEDGINWTSYTTENVSSLTAMCYAQDRFVGVKSSTAYVSTNGTEWSSHSIGITASDIFYGNNEFVVYYYNWNNSAISSSPDGYSWTTRWSGSNPTHGVAWNGEKYLRVEPSNYYAYFYESYDLISWKKLSNRLSCRESWGNKLGAGGRQFIFGNCYGGIFISPDGIDWKTVKGGGSSASSFYTKIISTGNINAALYSSSMYISDNNFSVSGFALDIPLTQYEIHKKVELHAPVDVLNATLNINNLGAKPINGTIHANTNYTLSYNGTSWDIENKDFTKQEIVFGETMFNNQKQFACFMIGLLKNDTNLKIVMPNSEITLYTQEENKEIKVITTDTTISIINSTDNTENIIYRIIN